MTAIRAELLAAVRAALVAGAQPAGELARRADLSARTVRRLRKGQRVSTRTLEALADALGVDVSTEALEADLRATIREVLAEQRAADSGRNNSYQVGTPVCGWEQAAIRLKVSRMTLFRRRRAACDDSAPWWPDEGSLHVWYLGVLSAGRGRDAAVTVPESLCDGGR